MSDRLISFPDRHPTLSIIGGVLAGPLAFGPSMRFTVWVLKSSPRERAIGDQAVDTLFHSGELVEVLRLGEIVRRLTVRSIASVNGWAD